MNSKTLSFILLLCFTGFIACDNVELPPPETPAFCDNLDEPFYNTNVKQIIDESCAYAGCHINGGIGPGNYSTYSGMLTDLQSGSFRARVIDQIDNPAIGMPPDQSVYTESIKDDLTQEELEIIQCWLDAGFPEG